MIGPVFFSKDLVDAADAWIEHDISAEAA